MKKIILSALLALASTVAVAKTATIAWEAPTARVDGTPLSAEEIQSYEIFRSVDDGEHLQYLAVPPDPTGLSNAVQTELSTGVHCFYLTTVDTDGTSSEPSDTACLQVKSPPGNPLKVIIKIVK